MAATLGVATFSYLPYAVFNYASPLLAIAIAYLGVRMLRGPETPERVTASPADSGPARQDREETT
jgi:NhaC family Na+:H+ antiporter